MLVNQSEFLISAVKVEQFPNPTFPQYLLMGRSNVGKSSFINAVTNRKNLAYTSSKPGKTETLNFYLCNNKFMFVDAPGYGYAKKAKEKRVDFGYLLEKYLNSNVNVKTIFQIIDIRHDPTEDDILVYEFLKQYNIDVYIIATKADKISKNQINTNKKNIQNILGVSENNIIVFSSINKTGVNLVEGVLNSNL